MLAQVATLSEIDTHWSLLDVLDAHIALDAQQEAHERQQDEARRKAQQERPGRR